MISPSKYKIEKGDFLNSKYKNFFTLMLADPPFGIDFNNRLNTRAMGYDGYAYEDDMSNDEYYKFSLDWINKCYDSLKDNGSLYIFSGWNKLFEILKACKQTKFELTNHCIWRYKFGIFCNHKYVTSHYHLLFLTKGKYKFYGHYEEDVIDIGSNYRSDNKYVVEGHPCQLPVKLLKYLIFRSSNFGDWVGDVFSGSGGTALACRMLGRNVVSFEKEDKYIDVIKSKMRFGKSIMLDNIDLSMLL
jgi:site-specific DNA-methyltransferase (adenine-specific)